MYCTIKRCQLGIIGQWCSLFALSRIFSAKIAWKDTTNICRQRQLAAPLRSRQCQDALQCVLWYVPLAAKGPPRLSCSSTSESGMRPDLAAQLAFHSRPSSSFIMSTAQCHLVRAIVTSIQWQILYTILKYIKRCSQRQHFLCYITRWKHASPILESLQHSNHDGSSRGAKRLEWGVQLSSCSSHTVRSLACLSKL